MWWRAQFVRAVLGTATLALALGLSSLESTAFAATARATPSAAGAGPGKAIDAAPSTAWRPATRAGWIRIDLGRPRSIRTVRTEWSRATLRHRIRVSRDGRKYRTVAVGAAGSAGARARTFPATKARYVRIEVRRPEQGSAGALASVDVVGPEGLALVGSGSRVGSVASTRGSSQSRATRRAADGNRRTAWRSRAGKQHWIRFDLGSAMVLTALEASWRGRAPARHKVQLSRDGRRYRTLARGRGPLALGFRPQQARFVRIIAAPGKASARVGVSEVAFYARARDNQVEKAGGKRARASTRSGTAGRANDHRSATRWRSRKASRHWWEVDLGAPALIDALHLQWGGSPPRRFRVVSSLDGRRFAPMVRGGANQPAESLHGVRRSRARYLRIISTGKPRQRSVALREVGALGPGEPGFERPRPAGGTTGSSGPGAGAAGSPAPSLGPRGNFDFVGTTASGGLHNSSPDELASVLDRASGLGARWMRVDLNWSVVQDKGPTVFEWGAQDAVIDAIVARGMRPIITLGYTPSWARRAECSTSSVCSPADPAAFAAFAAAAVRRYAPRGVKHWEIWNEPNIDAFWLPRPEPARYAALLKATYPAIKNADPTATVISGGLSPYGAYPASAGGRTNPVKFLEEVYAAGGADRFDALGMHPYNHPESPDTAHPALAWTQLEQTNPSIRSLMAANGDAGKRVWATEFGYPTCTTESLCVSEEAQATFTARAIDLWSTYPWTGPLVLYRVEDRAPNTAIDRFGFYRLDGSAKPVVTVVRSRTGA